MKTTNSDNPPYVTVMPDFKNSTKHLVVLRVWNREDEGYMVKSVLVTAKTKALAVASAESAAKSMGVEYRP